MFRRRKGVQTLTKKLVLLLLIGLTTAVLLI
ncbi:hypothetical protein Ahy_A09g045127 isoform D [Arachis hypogaea]|uniref:Uncharacterized protein n=1 Tax=Arachis hypogaea TaxID=3818 RepID=A0A445BLL8_ARAHY|nr:hypothetical protein Ahy_A09g045127 isoform D [Arachis hypogaea]